MTLALLVPVPKSAVAAGESPPVQVVINGRVLHSDPPAFVAGGRTLVPMRAVLEALGAKLEWDGSRRTATASNAQHQVRVTIGDRVAYRDGQAVLLDVPAQIVQDRTFLPLRFTAESLGGSVEWDGATRTARIWGGSGDSVSLPPEIARLKNPRVVKEIRLTGDPWGVRRQTGGFAQVQPNVTPIGPGANHCEADYPVVGYTNCLVGWEGESATVEWARHVRGSVRADNRNNSGYVDLEYSQSTSGSVSTTLSGSVSVGASASIKASMLKFLEGQLSGQITVTGAGSWSWTAGQTQAAKVSMKVPPEKVGYIFSYASSAAVKGQAQYELWQVTSDGAEHFVGNKAEPVWADVPTAGNYSFKSVEADS